MILASKLAVVAFRLCHYMYVVRDALSLVAILSSEDGAAADHQEGADADQDQN